MQNLWALFFGVAVIAPVLVHWLTRPRPATMPLSTLRFVREAVQQRRARHRWRDFLVLALRTLAICLIVLAVARPPWGEQPLVSDASQGETVRVVVLDVSQSMAAVRGGIEQFERARTLAAGHLKYRPDLHGNLILAGAQPRAVFTEPSQNFEALREALAKSGPKPERLDVSRALAHAAEMLAPASENDHRRRELVIVSDFQRSNWGQADFSPLPEETQIQLESTAPVRRLPNVALLAGGVRGRASQGGAASLEVEIGNYSDTPRRMTVEVLLGDAVHRLEGACPAGRRTTLAREIPLQAAGWQTGKARLVDVDDALPADDARALVVEVRSKPVYALITRQRSSERPSSSHFLECALAPDANQGEDASARVQRVAAEAVDSETLAPADLIFIDHPGRLEAEAIHLLAGLMRRGKPIVYVAAEYIDATNLYELTDAAGTGLQMPVEFAPPPGGQIRRDLFLASLDNDTPLFGVFGDATDAVFGRLRFAGGLSSRRRAGTLQDDILATYNDGTAFITLTTSDAGALAVVNADLGRSNLATSEAFLPLVDQLVRRLLQHRGLADRLVCGERLEQRLPAGVRALDGLKVVGPPLHQQTGDAATAEQANAAGLGELVETGGGVVWRWASPDRPGAYRVERDGEVVYATSVGLAQEESNLESLTADVLQTRLAGGRSVYFRAAEDADSSRDDLWSWLLAACVACLIVEAGALTLMRT
jgi:hypothetical protein